MKVHFFSRTALHSRADFQLYYIQQNLNATQTLSLIYFLLCLTIRVIIEFYNVPLKKVTHLDEYDMANWISLAVTPIFYFGSIQLRHLFELDKKYLRAIKVVVFVFALYIIINTMRATFYSMHNPRNTLVMYLMGLVITGVFFTFEFYESLALAIITGISFSVTLTFYQTDFNEVFKNNMASLVLLTVFFSISRLVYSYRADNFFKIKAIEEKNIEIEKASQVKNEILGVVAHDLRNPLAAIKSLAQIMAADTNIDEDNQENLQMIKASCEKATSIINDLLETAHNEVGSELELQPIELNRFLLLIVDEWLKNKTDKTNILFYGTKQPVYAMINREKMHRAMDNLISNAVKFSGSSNHIEISLNELNGEVFIAVKDFGVGIPDDLMPFIFDRFSKASRKGVRGEGSIGLGLSIVHEIVRKHNAEIVVNSNEKKGTTFTISLRSLASA